jgi:hypothetical protein
MAIVRFSPATSNDARVEGWTAVILIGLDGDSPEQAVMIVMMSVMGRRQTKIGFL